MTGSTDSGLALKTRKGTGFYKISSLRGVWYRPRMLHNGSVASLKQMFDPARFNLGTFLLSVGRYDEGYFYCNQLPADNANRMANLGRALLGQGEMDEAIRIFITGEDRRYLGYLGYADARSGRREEV